MGGQVSADEKPALRDGSPCMCFGDTAVRAVPGADDNMLQYLREVLTDVQQCRAVGACNHWPRCRKEVSDFAEAARLYVYQQAEAHHPFEQDVVFTNQQIETLARTVLDPRAEETLPMAIDPERPPLRYLRNDARLLASKILRNLGVREPLEAHYRRPAAAAAAAGDLSPKGALSEGED